MLFDLPPATEVFDVALESLTVLVPNTDLPAHVVWTVPSSWGISDYDSTLLSCGAYTADEFGEIVNRVMTENQSERECYTDLIIANPLAYA